MKNKLNGNLYGKRKFLSAWGVFLICLGVLISGKIDQNIFKDLTIFVWGFYFGANTFCKFSKNGKGDK
jgi:hypothetical protein